MENTKEEKAMNWKFNFNLLSVEEDRGEPTITHLLR